MTLTLILIDALDLEGIREIRATVSGGGDLAPLAEDMQARVAVLFTVWATAMLDDGREDGLRAALVAVRGERAAEIDMARLRRSARRRD